MPLCHCVARPNLHFYELLGSSAIPNIPGPPHPNPRYCGRGPRDSKWRGVSWKLTTRVTRTHRLHNLLLLFFFLPQKTSIKLDVQRTWDQKLEPVKQTILSKEGLCTSMYPRQCLHILKSKTFLTAAKQSPILYNFTFLLIFQREALNQTPRCVSKIYSILLFYYPWWQYLPVWWLAQHQGVFPIPASRWWRWKFPRIGFRDRRAYLQCGRRPGAGVGTFHLQQW